MSYRYDLHVHTDASPCSRSSPRAVVEAALEAGLDGIAITDHDTTANVRAVQRAAPPDLAVVPGVEVSTADGHLLAIDVEEPPPRGDLPAVIEHVRDRGGFAIAAHPFDGLRESVGPRLRDAIDGLSAVEAVNSRCVRRAFNGRAGVFADRRGLPTTGGSDAHFPFEVGRAYTLTERPLREALARGETSPAGRGGYLSGHAATKVVQYLPG